MEDSARSLLRFSLWSLAAYAVLGLALEGLHGFKIGWYLSAATTLRRELFTLAHAHGTLFSLVGVAIAASHRHFDPKRTRRIGTAFGFIKVTCVIVPLGFLLGGLFAEGGDPGLGILLVPLGAMLFIGSLVLGALSVDQGKGAL